MKLQRVCECGEKIHVKYKRFCSSECQKEKSRYTKSKSSYKRSNPTENYDLFLIKKSIRSNERLLARMKKIIKYRTFLEKNGYLVIQRNEEGFEALLQKPADNPR